MDPSLNISHAGAGEETTYVSSSQPTNQPTAQPPPNDYISVRITLPEDSWGSIYDVLPSPRSFIAYPHMGKSKSNPHWHLLIPSVDTKYIEKLRKRFKTVFPDHSGNGFVSIKQWANGLLQGIQYCSHEGTLPAFTCDLEPYVRMAPKWVDKVQSMLPLAPSKKKDADSDWQLSYTNVVAKSINHARQYALTGSLKDVLCHMLEHTKWRPSFHMIKNGVPDFYHKDFEFRSGKRHKIDMSWMDPKF